MKIGVFLTQYPYPHHVPGYFTGGTGHVAQTLARGLAKQGHAVKVFTTSKDAAHEEACVEGIDIVRYPKAFAVAQTYIAPKLATAPSAEPMDIAHVHAGNPPATFGALAAKKKQGIPLVLTYHGDFQASYGSMVRRTLVAGYTAWFKRYLLPKADAVICPSETFVDDSPILAPHRDRIQIIPNGIDPAEVPSGLDRHECRSRFGWGDDDVVFLFLGSLVPYKGPDILVDAFIRAHREAKNCRLLLVGDGFLRPELAERVQKAGVSDAVKFLGSVSELDKWRALAASDAFVLPSTMRTENFPIVLLEAQLMGLPLITSDLPTFRSQVIEGYNGLTSIRGDAVSLSGCIRRLAHEGTLRRKLGVGARENVRRFESDRITGQTESLFKEILQ